MTGNCYRDGRFLLLQVTRGGYQRPNREGGRNLSISLVRPSIRPVHPPSEEGTLPTTPLLVSEEKGLFRIQLLMNNSWKTYESGYGPQYLLRFPFDSERPYCPVWYNSRVFRLSRIVTAVWRVSSRNRSGTPRLPTPSFFFSVLSLGSRLWVPGHTVHLQVSVTTGTFLNSEVESQKVSTERDQTKTECETFLCKNMSNQRSTLTRCTRNVNRGREYPEGLFR